MFNGGNGVTLNGVITGSTASNNGGNGIEAGTPATIVNNHTEANQGVGIASGEAGSVIVGNSVNINANGGISAQGAVVAYNAAADNLDTAITTAGGASLVGNSVSNSTLSVPAIELSNNDGFGNNVASGTFTPLVSGGIQMGTNVCGTSSCP